MQLKKENEKGGHGETTVRSSERHFKPYTLLQAILSYQLAPPSTEKISFPRRLWRRRGCATIRQWLQFTCTRSPCSLPASVDWCWFVSGCSLAAIIMLITTTNIIIIIIFRFKYKQDENIHHLLFCPTLFSSLGRPLQRRGNGIFLSRAGGRRVTAISRTLCYWAESGN